MHLHSRNNYIKCFLLLLFFDMKIESEHHQKMPQLQTADKPVAPRGRTTQQSQDTSKTSKAKQLALFSLKMIKIRMDTKKRTP